MVFFRPIFVDRSHLIYSNALAYQFVLLVLFTVATAMLFRTRKSVLDMWLLVALAGWLMETLLVLTLFGRFTAGWYGLFILTLFSHLVVIPGTGAIQPALCASGFIDGSAAAGT